MSNRARLVVAGKLRQPRQRRDVVHRRHLVDRIMDGFTDGASVTLVCAPGGAGKTTLITSYLDDAPGLAAWLQVDGLDNDPARFWAHLTTALSQLNPQQKSQVQPAWLRTGDWASVAAAVAAELEELAGVTLVIDDFHHITAPVIHEGVDRLLQWLPPVTNVVLSTRVDPPLRSLGRMRVRGELVEVRAADLSFGVAEASMLLAGAADGEVSTADVTDLVAKTEGWAAGLYLAGLSIKRHGQRAEVVASFDGHDRFVADYLRSEFLADLDTETRGFMLRTSILDELTGPLCDSVTGTVGSADRLRELERSNLLVIPLDNNDEWFRYHHLLEQWLRAELTATEPDQVGVLHRRAARWCRAHHRIEAGFTHAIAAADMDLAAAIVEEAWHETMLSGRVFTVRDWFQSLGQETIDDSVSLTTAMARLCLNTGRPHEEVASWLTKAETLATANGQASDGETGQAAIDRVWALHLRQRGDLRGAEQRARSLCAAVTGDLGGEDLMTIGSILHLVGELDEARALLTKAVSETRDGSDALDYQLAEGHLAAVDYELGYRREARQRAEAVLGTARALGLESWPTVMVANYVLGLLALDDNESESAVRYLETALDQAKRARYRPIEMLTLLASARLHASEHHTVEARRVLELARGQLAEMPNPGRLADLIPVAGQQLQLAPPAVDSPGSGTLIEDLTERELSVLRLFPSQLSLRDIGAELYVSHNTVKGHVKAIYRKLDVHSREAAVERATTLSLL